MAASQATTAEAPAELAPAGVHAAVVAPRAEVARRRQSLATAFRQLGLPLWVEASGVVARGLYAELERLPPVFERRMLGAPCEVLLLDLAQVP